MQRLQFSRTIGEIPLYRRKIGIENLFFGDEDVGALFEVVLKPEKSGFQTPFGEVSCDCIADFFTCCKADFFATPLFIKEDSDTQMFSGGVIVKISKLFVGL